MFTKIDTFFQENNFNKIFFVTILLLSLLGIHNRFIQDDAFISFRYAQHFAQGHGLTWNIGEQQPVEGYTNFLWVMMIAVAEALELDPVLWSMILGISFGVGTLFFTYRLSLMLLQLKSIALLTVILLGTNYTFSSYMTGGLETQLQTFLIIVSTYYSFCVARHDKYLNQLWLTSLSVFFSLAVMTRLDSVLICGILYFFIIFVHGKKAIPLKEKIFYLSFLTFPGAIIVGAWLFFKFIYYGDILPNTYYVKTMDESILRGLWYSGTFLSKYSLVIIVFLGLFYFKEIFSKPNLRLLLVIISVWFFYVIRVNGDFMEYRLFVPILPLIFILTSYIIFTINHLKVQASIVVLLLFSSCAHALAFNGNSGIESIYQLNGHVVNKDQNWRGVGIVLGEMFLESEKPVIIATMAAGAIPYYSKLPTIDMLGLNDRWVAKNGIVTDLHPGHTRLATLEYLLESNVNLIVGHPQIKPISSPTIRDLRYFFLWDIDFSSLPTTSKIIEIPLNSSYRIEVLYIRKHDYIDEKIAELNLTTHRIVRK